MQTKILEEKRPTEERPKVAIEIRRAEPGEQNEIWNILHAEGIGWDDCRIAENCRDLFVLRAQGKLVAVMYADSSGGNLNVHWIAVHPLYPLGAVSAALRHAVSGAVLRRTEITI